MMADGGGCGQWLRMTGAWIAVEAAAEIAAADRDC